MEEIYPPMQVFFSSKNFNRMDEDTLAYNLFNWFRRLALATDMRKQRIDTIRLKLLKTAAVFTSIFDLFVA